MVDVLTIVHAFKKLNTKDVDFSTLAISTLVTAVTKRLGRPAAEENLTGYLFGDTTDNFASASSKP